jgi:hypothetical protein
MADIKWSAFPSTVSPGAGDVLVGLHAGANTKFTGLTIPFSPTVGGTGVANAVGKTITLGAALTTSGAFASTFTMTGVTSVTFPTSGTLQTTAGASGIVNSGLINQLGYYAAAGTTISGLATANNGLLVTSATGVPSIGNAILADITVNGVKVGRGNGSISTNTACGFQALLAATAGGLVAVGYQALVANTSGSVNTAVGFTALTANTTGSQNTAFAYGALTANTTGAFNSGFGVGAGGAITTGTNNTCIGNAAGQGGAAGAVSLTTGTYNTFIGQSACGNNIVTVGSIALGANAVSTMATGATSVTNGPGISIGSATYPVGFRGDGTIYPGNLWRVKVNGTQYMIPLAVDGSTSLPVANGGTNLTSTTANQLLYSSATNTIAGLATANNGVLITSASGVPSISSTLPSGIAATNMALTTPSLGAATATSINFGGSSLSDYVATTAWTPTVTFATPGDLSVAYAIRSGYYTRVGRTVTLQFNLYFTPTFTTSSGTIQITGLPVAVFDTCYGTVVNQTSIVYPATTTWLALIANSGTTILTIYAAGTASGGVTLAASDFVSGVAYLLPGTITYLV